MRHKAIRQRFLGRTRRGGLAQRLPRQARGRRHTEVVEHRGSDVDLGRADAIHRHHARHGGPAADHDRNGPLQLRLSPVATGRPMAMVRHHDDLPVLLRERWAAPDCLEHGADLGIDIGHLPQVGGAVEPGIVAGDIDVVEVDEGGSRTAPGPTRDPGDGRGRRGDVVFVGGQPVIDRRIDAVRREDVRVEWVPRDDSGSLDCRHLGLQSLEIARPLGVATAPERVVGDAVLVVPDAGQN